MDIECYFCLKTLIIPSLKYNFNLMCSDCLIKHSQIVTYRFYNGKLDCVKIVKLLQNNVAIIDFFDDGIYTMYVSKYTYSKYTNLESYSTFMEKCIMPVIKLACDSILNQELLLFYIDKAEKRNILR